MGRSDGICYIREEFLIKKNESQNPEEIDNTLHLNGKRKQDVDGNHQNTKKTKSNPDENGQLKNKRRGQNKARPKTFNLDKNNKACPTIICLESPSSVRTCKYPNCKYIHDPLEYLKAKPQDIDSHCYLFTTHGYCPRGITCRFGTEHITKEGCNIVSDKATFKDSSYNTLQSSLQTLLQKKKYDFDFAEKLVKHLDKRNNATNSNQNENDGSTKANNSYCGSVTDEDLIKLLPREKKTIDWKDKLYLSPLTTVGNLPFRRICKEFGADITCGEMALCESLLKGLKQEWALVKRHESENIFGAQICGNNPYTITKVAHLLQQNTQLDFIDLNLGCPIDLIYKKGGGSGMLHRMPTLETSIKCASTLLNIPFTVKMRTGIYQDKKIAHSIIPKMKEWGPSLITLHGRSREARYTKSADWEYIEMCAKYAAPCPVFGNGDILSYEDYLQKKELAPSVQGVMIGRGALIKPWIFNEIKEQKLWDISSSERFDILKKFTNYGLEHWGSDTQGVENTRRFLLEWLSFLYRYVPVGLLERPPQKINERPPSYIGRNTLETLMASGNCADWIKISEMLLGPVPDDFKFLPKHKANSYT